MKRHLSVLACLVLVLTFVLSLASCDVINKLLGKEPEHTHDYVDGKCECGESDPDYVAPHTHNFVDGKCECGEEDPNYVPPTKGTADDPHAIEIPGTVKITLADDGVVYYVFTITENKTLKVTFDSDNVSVACDTSADDLLNKMYDVGEARVLETSLAAGTYYVAFATTNFKADEYTAVAEFVDKVSPYEEVIYEGNYNKVTFSAAEIEADAATRKLVITTDSTYMFKGDIFVSKIVAADGTEVTKNADFSYNLAAGEYTVSFGMFSIYQTDADKAISLNVEDQNAPDDGGEGSDIDITGTYYGTDDFGNQSLTIVINDTTVTFTYSHPMMGETVATYTYAIVEGEVVLYDDDNNVVPAMGGFISLSINGVPVDAGFNGTNYTLSTTQGGGSGDDDGDDTILPEVGTGSGTEEDPYIIAIPGDFTCDFPGGWNAIWYAFAAPADGTVTISTTFGANGWIQLGTEPMFCNTNEGDGTSLTLFVEANKLYYAAVGDWSEVASIVPFSITFTEGEGGGDDDGDDTTEIVTEGYLYDGENEVVITDEQYAAGKVYYQFMPSYDGEYTFWSGDLYISAIYCDGEVLTQNDYGYYVLSSYTPYVVEISCEWVMSAGTYTVNADYNYPLGHQENPNWIYNDLTEAPASITATYQGDYQVVWYAFYAPANGTITVSTENKDAILLLNGMFGYVDIESVDGVATISVMADREYHIGINDISFSNTAYDVDFTVTFTAGEYVADGSVNAPYILALGSNTANVPEYGNVWYVYTAASNGTLSVTTENAVCAWYFVGEDDYATSGDKSAYFEWGEMVYLYIETSDWSAAEIVFNASIKEDPKEVYYENAVINDGTAANEFVIEENTWVAFSFGGAGQYAITWDNADAKVELVDWGMPNTALVNGGIIDGSMWGVNLIVYLPEYAAGTVNITITPQISEESSLVLGDNSISVIDTQFGDVVNLPVSEEDVTYVVTPVSNAVVIYDYEAFLESVEITVPANATVSINVINKDSMHSDAVINVAIKGTEVEGGEGEGDDEGDEPVVIPDLEIGNTQYNASAITYSYTASMDGVLTLTSGAAIMGPVNFSYTVNGGDAIEFAVSTTVEITLVAGDVVILNISGSGYSSISAAFAVPPTEVAGTLANIGENTFTLEDNTYVLIPLRVMGMYEITWADTSVIVEYQENMRAPFVTISSGAVATLNPMAGANLRISFPGYAAGTVTINVAEYVDTPVDAVVGDNTISVVDTQFGKVVNLPVSDADVTYVVTPGINAVVVYDYTNYFAGETVEIAVAANATVSFNVVTENFSASDVVVNVAVKGTEGEGSGTTVADVSGTYLSAKHASGRVLQVVIDTTAGTMTITRSDLTGNLTTGGVSVSVYTYDATAPVFQSGTSCTIVMENGIPTKITWGSATFEGFTKQ